MTSVSISSTPIVPDSGSGSRSGSRSPSEQPSSLGGVSLLDVDLPAMLNGSGRQSETSPAESQVSEHQPTVANPDAGAGLPPVEEVTTNPVLGGPATDTSTPAPAPAPPAPTAPAESSEPAITNTTPIPVLGGPAPDTSTPAPAPAPTAPADSSEPAIVDSTPITSLGLGNADSDLAPSDPPVTRVDTNPSLGEPATDEAPAISNAPVVGEGRKDWYESTQHVSDTNQSLQDKLAQLARSILGLNDQPEDDRPAPPAQHEPAPQHDEPILEFGPAPVPNEPYPEELPSPHPSGSISDPDAGVVPEEQLMGGGGIAEPI